MSSANPFRGVLRIHGELLKLGVDVRKATVGICRGAPRPPSPTWRRFLHNHLTDTVAIDNRSNQRSLFWLVNLMAVRQQGNVLHLNQYHPEDINRRLADPKPQSIIPETQRQKQAPSLLPGVIEARA